MQAPESSFGGVWIAGRVQKTVPGGRTSNDKVQGQPYVGDAVRIDLGQQKWDVSGWTVGRSEGYPTI